MSEKPRVKYTDFVAQRITQHAEGSVAWLIEKYIAEKSQPGRRRMGNSQTYTLKLIQRSKLGKLQASKLKAADFIEHCSVRRAAGIQPATIKQDMTFLVIVL